MAGNKRNNAKLEGHLLESEILRAMRAEGWLVPETAEEVLEAERALSCNETHQVSRSIPPRELLSSSGKVRVIRSERHVMPGLEVSENLARAAREGGELSSEIEERMKRDRDAAEAKDRG